MSFDWGAVISAGVSLASGLLEDENREQQFAQSRENQILQLQDNERGRVAQADRLATAEAGALERAQLAASAQLEATNKRILGDVLLDQGKGQETLMLESFRSSANAPERFNNAASVLAQVLAR